MLDRSFSIRPNGTIVTCHECGWQWIDTDIYRSAPLSWGAPSSPGQAAYDAEAKDLLDALPAARVALVAPQIRHELEVFRARLQQLEVRVDRLLDRLDTRPGTPPPHTIRPNGCVCRRYYSEPHLCEKIPETGEYYPPYMWERSV
jgi:hypothetical protein